MPARTRRSVLTLVISWPSKIMAPFQAGTRPISTLSKVVLPAPLAPSSTTVSPRGTKIPAPQSTWIEPYPASMPSALRIAPSRMFGSEIDFDHARILYRLRKPALKDLLARIHNHDAVRDLVDEAHQMLHHEQPHARNGQIPEFHRDILQ